MCMHVPARIKHLLYLHFFSKAQEHTNAFLYVCKYENYKTYIYTYMYARISFIVTRHSQHDYTHTVE